MIENYEQKIRNRPYESQIKSAEQLESEKLLIQDHEHEIFKLKHQFACEIEEVISEHRKESAEQLKIKNDLIANHNLQISNLQDQLALEKKEIDFLSEKLVSKNDLIQNQYEPEIERLQNELKKFNHQIHIKKSYC